MNLTSPANNTDLQMQKKKIPPKTTKNWCPNIFKQPRSKLNIWSELTLT